MQNRLIRTTLVFGQRQAARSADIALILRDTVSGFISTTRAALMVVGLLTLAVIGLAAGGHETGQRALALLAPPPEPAAEEQPALATALLPLPGANATPVGAAASSEDVLRQQQRLANWIAKRYRVAGDATQMFVNTAYQTARELKLDPLLILSVIAIESRFNPFAESPVGAQGLMQVMSRIHKDKFEPLGGIEAALNPVANIKVGSLILKEYVTRGGSVEAGLKMYVGAALLETDFGYGAKVLAEYDRMKHVAMGRKVSIYATTAAAPKQTPKTTAETPVQLSEATPASSPPTSPEPQPVAQAEQLASAL